MKKLFLGEKYLLAMGLLILQFILLSYSVRYLLRKKFRLASTFLEF
jgi:hypothetical protein